MYNNQSRIVSIGTAVPGHRISQQVHADLLESANGMSREDRIVMRKIYSRSGIEHRHSVLREFSHPEEETHKVFRPSGKLQPATVSERMELFETHALDLSVEATQQCLERAGADPKRITHLVTFSCTGMYAPGLDIGLVNQFEMEKSVERTCVNFMGCYAAINALKVAFHISRSQPEALVLIAGVELCTLHYQKSRSSDQTVANALFGDGAASALISCFGEFAPAGKRSLLMKAFYAEFEQAAADDMVWRIGNHGFNLYLSPQVPEIVRTHIAPMLEKLFARTGYTREQLDYYAIHPGGTKILEACELALGLDKQKNALSYEVLRENGNMSSVTVLFVLSRYLERLQPEDAGKNILACAFGPGITMESMICEIA